VAEGEEEGAVERRCAVLQHDALRIKARVTAAAVAIPAHAVGMSGGVISSSGEWLCACCDRRRSLVKGGRFPFCVCHPKETTWMVV